MQVSAVKEAIRGPMAPVLTIYREDLSLDLDAIQENVHQQIRRGLSKGKGVLLAAGAGGDFPVLSHDERKAVMKAVAEAAGDDGIVLGCAQSPSTREALELAAWAEKIGCYGIQLSPPWYYEPNEAQIYDFFKVVSQSVDICVMAYHTPWLGSHISMDLFRRMGEDFPNVRSIKWSAQTEREALTGYMELADQFAMVNNGPGCLNAALLGASSYVSHLANVWPEHEVAFWDSVERQDWGRVVHEYRTVFWPWRLLRSWAGKLSSGESPIVKGAAELTGFRGGPSRPPMIDLTEKHRAHVRTVLEKIGAPLV